MELSTEFVLNLLAERQERLEKFWRKWDQPYFEAWDELLYDATAP